MPTNLARPRPPSIALESELRALRCALWLSLFHSQQIPVVGFDARLLPLLGEVDRLLAELDGLA